MVLVTELILKLGRAHADPVGHELLFEDGHGQLEPRLDFGRIALHADKRATSEGRGNVLSDAIGALLVRNGDPEAFGFVFNLFLKNQLLQNLLGVEGLEGPHVGIALLDLVKLLAHILHADGLISDLGHGIGGDLAAHRRLRDKVEEHAASEDQNDGP